MDVNNAISKMLGKKSQDSEEEDKAISKMEDIKDEFGDE